VKSIKDDILSWSQDVIEKPNKHLGNFPTCPYANGCRTQNQFTIEEVHDAKQLLPTVVDWASKLKRTRYRIAIIGCSDLSITATELDASIEALNFVYMPKDVYLMASHPETGDDNVDFLYDHGFDTDNEFSMVLIQRYQDLENASQKLKKVGYYKYWEADYYKETVEHRQQLKRRIDMRGMKKTAKKVNGKLNSAIKKVKKTKKKKKK
jgi:hypothetical protein